VSYFFFIGTKQAIKGHAYANLDIPEGLRESFKTGTKGKVKLGAAKYQLLQFLAQLNIILPKSFWSFFFF
jgi:hypothetical protein